MNPVVPKTLEEAAKQMKDRMKKAEADTRLQHYDQKLLGMEKQLKEASERWEEAQQIILAAKVELEGQMAQMWEHLAEMQRDLNSFFNHQSEWERPSLMKGSGEPQLQEELLPEKKE